MRLRDYFFGRVIRLHSPLPVSEVEQVFRSTSGRFFWYWVHPVRDGRWDARLRFSGVRHPFSYNAKPVLDVLARSEDGGTNIWLTYRATSRVVSGLIFVACLWALFLSIFLYVLLFSDPQNVRWSDVGFLIVAPIVAWVVHKIGTRNSNRDLNRVLGLLRAETKAQVIQ